MRKSNSSLTTKLDKKINNNQIFFENLSNSKNKTTQLINISLSSRELPDIRNQICKLFERLFLSKNKKKSKLVNHTTKLSLKINTKLNSHIHQNKIRFFYKGNNHHMVSPIAINKSKMSTSTKREYICAKKNSNRFNTTNNNIKKKKNIKQLGLSCDNDYVKDNISSTYKNYLDENTEHQTFKTEIYTPSENNNSKKFNLCQIIPNNIYKNYKNNNINNNIKNNINNTINKTINNYINNNTNHINHINVYNNKIISKFSNYTKNDKQFLNHNNVINKKYLLLDCKNDCAKIKPNKKNNNKSLLNHVMIYIVNNSAGKQTSSKKIFSGDINNNLRKNVNSLKKFSKDEKNNKKINNTKNNSNKKAETKKLKRKVLSIKIHNSSSKIDYANFTKTFHGNKTPFVINSSSILTNQSSKNKQKKSISGNKYVNLKSSLASNHIKRNSLITGNYLHTTSNIRKNRRKNGLLPNLKNKNFDLNINYDSNTNKANKEFPIFKTTNNNNNSKKSTTKNNSNKKHNSKKKESRRSSQEKTIVEETCKVQVLKNYFQIAKKNLKEITIRKHSNVNNFKRLKVFNDFNNISIDDQFKIRNTVYSNNTKNEIKNIFNSGRDTSTKTIEDDEQFSPTSIKKIPIFSNINAFKTPFKNSSNLFKDIFFNLSTKKFRENIEKFLSIKEILILSSVNKMFYTNMKHIIFNYFFNKIIKQNDNNIFLKKIFKSLFKYSSLKDKNKTELKEYYSMNKNKNKSIYNEIILKDLPRTFPNEKSFNKENKNYTKLYNLLISYSNFNKKIGYAQGLNFLFATAIFIFENEEEIFIFTDGLINLLNLENYLGIDNKNLMIKIEELSFILNKYLPELISFLKKKCLNHEFFTTGWILTLFSNVMDRKCLLIVWGFMIVFGWKFFYCLVIQILFKFKNNILNGNEENLSAKMRTLLRDKEFVKDFDKIIVNTFSFMKRNISL